MKKILLKTKSRLIDALQQQSIGLLDGQVQSLSGDLVCGYRLIARVFYLFVRVFVANL